MDPGCPVCEAKAPHRCSSCLSVWYCSVEHQKEHWKIHCKVCPCFKIVEVPNLGKGFVATRNIKPGTIILDEGPVAMSPVNGAGAACLTCGLLGTSRKCTHCKWPICSLECEEHPFHTENECRIFASNGLTYSFECATRWSLQDLVMGIRVCLLKGKDPVKYQQVLQLCSQFSLRNEMDVGPVETTVMSLLSGVEGLKLDYEEISKLLRIFSINCFRSSAQECPQRIDLESEFHFVAGLYLQSSRINHSCIPNCHLELGPGPEFKIRIRTTVAVKTGEHLTVFYWLSHIDEITKLRQSNIRKNGNFRCNCARCQDPTELGTYRSGVICETCRENRSSNSGYFLPEDPLDFSARATWKCNRCQDIKLAVQILPMLEELDCRIKISRLRCGDTEDSLIDFCKSVLAGSPEVIVHPNHELIQQAMRVACNIICRQRDITTSSGDLVKFKRHLLSIQDLLTPGLTPGRAFLQEELSVALHYQCRALLAQQNDEQVERNCAESLELLKEALKFFKNGIPLSSGVIPAADSIKKDISKVLNNLAQLRSRR